MLDLTIEFDNAPTVDLMPPPGYSIHNEDATGHCRLHDLSLTTTVVTGSSDTSLVNCGVLAGAGGWNQSWASDLLPSVTNGMHVVAGTWLRATMVLTGVPGHVPERFNSVVVLRPHPSEPLVNAQKMADCANGLPISSIRMLGVQVFVDPPDEDDFQL